MGRYVSIGESMPPWDPSPNLVEMIDEFDVDNQIESDEDGQFGNNQDLNGLKNLHVNIFQRLATEGDGTNYYGII